MRKQVELPSGLFVTAHYSDIDNYPEVHSYSYKNRWVQPKVLARHEGETEQFITDHIEAELVAQIEAESENQIYDYADYMYDN